MKVGDIVTLASLAQYAGTTTQDLRRNGGATIELVRQGHRTVWETAYSQGRRIVTRADMEKAGYVGKLYGYRLLKVSQAY